jgi:hypothetical protein
MPDDARPRVDDPAEAHVPIPGEKAAHDMEEAEEHFLDPGVDPESNELHASGRVCGRCGHPFRPGDDVRRTVRGMYQHEVCGLP